MKSEKLTKRIYDDACGTAHGLELIGERWSLLILRELLLGPRRFTGLKRDLPGISANVLTQRLAELEGKGLVRRSKLPPPASIQVYAATEWGLEAEPVIAELGRWAARSPRHDPTLPLSPVAIMISFRAMMDRGEAAALAGTIGFRFGDTAYVGRLDRGAFPVRRDDPAGADAVVTASPEQLAAAAYGGAPLPDGAVEGDKALVERFLSLFSLPPKAVVEAESASP
ncbi:transcriptional regulator [Sphingomonas ginkgonis]|uniref:Transcriptional regulator n=1 Tax=Sphingomonas ginkgonis TaxID=2315330 RepID=A0A3R9X6E3_9SPHN|nr:winged helix-turn-helix transcriptional regulator [Sphingomonas ginkgonis]RST29887.1 transcriptional regulator [Sphingomonas ginkgonis]